MLRIRGLLIAVVVLAALAGGVYWTKKAQEAAAKKPPAVDASAPQILDLPPKGLVKIEIRRTGGETTTAERQPEKWRMTSPAPLRADQGAVESLALTVEKLKSDRLIERKAADLGTFGLANPALDVAFTEKNGKTGQVLVGDEVPTGSGYYVKLGNDPRVFIISSYDKTALDKTEKDLRDKRYLPFDYDTLARIELTAKGQTVEFAKNNRNEWQILKPRPLRADGGMVNDLISKLRDAEIDTSVSDEDAKKATAAYATGAPVAIARVTDAAGTQQLQIRKDKENNYYATSSEIEGAHKVVADFGSFFEKSLTDWRNKKIFDFGWSDPSQIDVHDGAKSVSYKRSGEKWTSGGKTVDAVTMQTMVDTLRSLSASGFPEKGFTTPSLEISVTSSDGKRVEKASFSKTGNDWFAMRENEPSIYQLDGSVVEGLRSAIAAVKEAPPSKTAKK
jgi:hypothetical protein